MRTGEQVDGGGRVTPTLTVVGSPEARDPREDVGYYRPRRPARTRPNRDESRTAGLRAVATVPTRSPRPNDSTRRSVDGRPRGGDDGPLDVRRSLNNPGSGFIMRAIHAGGIGIVALALAAGP